MFIKCYWRCQSLRLIWDVGILIFNFRYFFFFLHFCEPPQMQRIALEKTDIRYVKGPDWWTRKNKEILRLTLTSQTARNVWRNSNKFNYEKMRKKPLLTIWKQKKRLEWALEKVSFGGNWRNVIFLDEKKLTWTDQTELQAME